MTNTNALELRIFKSGLTKTFLAGRLSISRQALYNKLDGVSDFKSTEIAILKELLKISDEDMAYYFFNFRLKNIQPKSA